EEEFGHRLSPPPALTPTLSRKREREKRARRIPSPRGERGVSEPRLAAGFRQGADAADIGGALGDADDAAGVEEVEEMARLQALVVGRKRQALVDEGGAFRLGVAEMREQPAGVGVFEIEGGELALGAAEDLIVGDLPGAGGAVVVEVEDALDALDIHGKAFQPIGQLGRDGIAFDAADLLKIGELADLHAVEPDLPAEAPGADRRALPIVLDEADVVPPGVDAERREAAEIERLAVGGGRLQDDLELVVMLQPVGVLAIAPVGRPARGLDIGGLPR